MGTEFDMNSVIVYVPVKVVYTYSCRFCDEKCGIEMELTRGSHLLLPEIPSGWSLVSNCGLVCPAHQVRVYTSLPPLKEGEVVANR